MERDLVLKCQGVRIDQPGERDDACRNSQPFAANRQAPVVRHRPGAGRGGVAVGMRSNERDCGSWARSAASASIGPAPRRAPQTCGGAALRLAIDHGALINRR
jgi:hypothetical protein